MGALEAEELVEVQEGWARLLVPRQHAREGPGTVAGRPFYNAAMALPRHVSVLVLGAVAHEAPRVLDALAGTGVLGIRLAREVPGDRAITLNDRRPDAAALIRRNLKRNGLEARVTSEDANLLLCRERFDYVDLDPFGSPVPFLDSALRALAPRGVLALTATDTAPLAGTYPRTCRRRYGATPLKGPSGHEVGLRILSGFVVRMAAKVDLAARPLLCLWWGHVYKTFFALRRGARRADAALEALGFVQPGPTGPPRVAAEGPVGPLWTGPLHEAALLERMAIPEHLPAEVARLLELWRAEADAPPFFFTTDELARRIRSSPPPLGRTLRTLREAGYGACRTSLHPKGVKTDAPWEEILSLLGGA